MDGVTRAAIQAKFRQLSGGNWSIFEASPSRQRRLFAVVSSWVSSYDWLRGCNTVSSARGKASG